MPTKDRTRRGSGRLAVLVALAATAALLTAGCVEFETPIENVPEWLVPQASREATGHTQTASDDPGPEMPAGAHGHGDEVLMLGRSVMYDWFDHWGWDGETSVKRDGYALYYGELDAPPDIATSAEGYIASAPEHTIVFFKLCFADFWASSSEEVDSNVEENLGYVRRVVEAAQTRGLPLVLGNALPSVASDTSPALVEAHLAYNAGLEEIAAARDGVYVFDQYSVLTSSDGTLIRGYAVAPSDSHLKDVAYVDLDQAFFSFMQERLPPAGGG
jgi:hypothetical protein